jgi:glycosyltransferase involved in cell wall biosynthesis
MTLKIDINGKFYSQEITGVQRYARQIVLALDSLLSDYKYKDKIKLRLLVPKKGFDIPLFKNIEVVRSQSLYGHIWEQFLLPVISYNNTLISLSGSAPWLKFKQYATIHDAAIYEFPEAYSKFFRYWYGPLFFWLSIICKKVFTVSFFSMERISAFLPQARSKLVVAYNGHEHLKDIEPDFRILDTLRLKVDSYFLVVGSLNPNKNLRYLVKIISEKLPHNICEFIFVGNSNPSVFSASPLINLPPNIHIAGYLNDCELKALYIKAKALIFPSIYEGFGIPLLEALSTSCPIIASNAASIPEVCGNLAHYFDPKDGCEMARSIYLAAVLPKEILEYREVHQQLAIFSWASSAEIILNTIIDIDGEPVNH